MKQVEAACPSCGANVVFKVSSSLVTVCEFCQSVVARGDTKLEEFGKVARIVPMASPFSLDVQGVYRHKSFEIVGHVQYQHAAGGVWNSWYASFPGDKWGWLAEAQGKIHLLFHRKLSGDGGLPAIDSLEVGGTLNIKGVERLTVAEIGQATIAGAEGEVPFLVRPGQSHDYVDLAGAEKAFATLEYDDDGRTKFYLGREVSLQELGLVAESGIVDAEVVEISSLQVACPQCGGSLQLVAPNETQRVVCQFCNSMLDASQGNLQYLETLAFKKAIPPVIPIGSTGHLRGADYTIIGFMRRSVTFDRDYFWSEYLLYNPENGFRWLVHSDDHWSFVETVSAGDVDKFLPSSKQLNYKGKSFALFQLAEAKVRYVLGEFYWKVSLDELVQTADYIRPPYSISEESALFEKSHKSGKSDEIIYSYGEYLPHEELEKAFNVRDLKRGWGVAPNQPRPVTLKPLMLGWGAFALAVLVINLIASVGLSLGTVDKSWFWVALIALSVIPVSALIYSHSFETRRWQDSDFSPYNTE